MYQHKPADFDYLIDPYQEKITKYMEKIKEIHNSINKEILNILGTYTSFKKYDFENIPNKNKNEEDINNSVLIRDIMLRHHKKESINNSLKNSIIQNKLDERNNRIQINNTMSIYSRTILDSIKNDFKRLYQKELSDNIIYTLQPLLKERFSLDEDGKFAKNLNFYKSYDLYLKVSLMSKEDSGFQKEFFINLINTRDLNDKEFERLRNHISSYLLNIIIPEVNQIYGRMKFSREKRTEYFLYQENTARQKMKIINQKLQAFSN